MINTLKTVNEAVLAEIQAEQSLRRTSEVFLLFSLGSQFDHLIKLALDRLGVYCLVADPGSLSAADVARLQPKGIILSGGPASVHVQVPPFHTDIFDLGIPVLGICLGFQLWASHRGMFVSPSVKREYGTHLLSINSPEAELFDGIGNGTAVLQSHVDRVESAEGLEVLAGTDHAPIAAARMDHLWGVQFHPEVTDTVDGERMLENFCFRICRAQDRYPAGDEAQRKVAEIKRRVGDQQVLLALSGGSDSTALAYLLRAAVPGQIHAVYIKGIDRPDDEAYVRRFFGDQDWLTLSIADASTQFLEALRGKKTMHDKRVAMRGVYKQALEREAAACGAGFIAQGTLYTDISESGGGYTSGARKAQIKLHHNTGLGFGLPELTPLDDCVKDTARQIGRAVGAPEELMVRHPFPGPGLVVRIEGEIDAEKLLIARQADGIFIEELRRHGLYEGVWQAGAVVTQSITTCSKGDDAPSGLVLALWVVWSVNGFTAQWAELPFEFLRLASKRLTNEIDEVGAVVYRISDKPPATIEWG
ncbi:glutamine-hydrolyzing GMP synthase [Candidatus Parcubacteria bacterium]|nr:glutamine-hydrolyzing GMP synthase [Candidatus Parcubacteria bacterium]